MAVIDFPAHRYTNKSRLGRIRVERNPYGKGWVLTIQFGPGAGYRWVDFGPYRQSIHARWWEHLTICGRTARIGTNVKVNDKRRRFAFHLPTKNANRRFYPWWW